MEFNSQICTTEEQSKRLLALGLKKETADMVILEHPRKEGRYFYITKEDANWDGFPAWSLHRLIEMADTYIEFSPFTGVYFRDGAFITDMVNDYDAIIAIIEWLIKEENFNKEYLEEKK